MRFAAQVTDRERTGIAKLAFWKKGDARQTTLSPRRSGRTTRSSMCVIL